VLFSGVLRDRGTGHRHGNIFVFTISDATALIRKPGFLISAAWLVHIVSWFVPVHEYEVRLHPVGLLHVLHGWEAFQFALLPVYWDVEWYAYGIAVLSALSTVLFVLGSPLLVLHGTPRLTWASACASSVAFVVNAQWYFLGIRVVDDIPELGTPRAQLKIGYFLWCLSFAILALGLFALAREERRVSSYLPARQNALVVGLVK
jgi:hypothetical protein